MNLTTIDPMSSASAPHPSEEVDRPVFHVKHRRPLAPLLFLAALALIAVACTRVASPEGWAAPVADGDRIFVQLERGSISAGSFSSAGTFTEEWRYPTELDNLEFDGFYATPVVQNNVVYIASYDGNVVALDVDSGRPLWSAVTEIGDNVVATPLIAGPSLYVPTEKGELVVLDAENGAETDRLLERNGRIWAAPVERGGQLYVGKFDARELWVVNAADGTVAWTQDVGGAVSADLVFANDLVLAGSLDRSIHAFDTTGPGAERWTYPTRGWIVATPLVAGDIVYGGTLRGEVFAINASDGAERWRTVDEDLEFRASPALIDGVLVVADRDGRLRGLDPATGETRWQTDLENAKLFANPIVIDGDLLYVTKDGDLIKVTPNDGSADRVFDRGG